MPYTDYRLLTTDRRLLFTLQCEEQPGQNKGTVTSGHEEVAFIIVEKLRGGVGVQVAVGFQLGELTQSIANGWIAADDENVISAVFLPYMDVLTAQGVEELVANGRIQDTPAIMPQPIQQGAGRGLCRWMRTESSQQLTDLIMVQGGLA
jgi:hypothetical protein